MHEALLNVENATVLFGSNRAVKSVSLKIEAGEAVAVVGFNGAGKTTLARVIAGDLKPSEGKVVLKDGHESLDLLAFGATGLVRRGIVLVPSTGAVFGSFSIAENLKAVLAALGVSRSDRRNLLEDVYGMFPILGSRRSQLAGSLSGGETKLLAVARGVLAVAAAGRVREPRRGKGFSLLIVDEPTHGLHPGSIRRVGEALRDLLRRSIALLIMEEMAPFALDLASRAYVMRQGRFVASGESSFLRERNEIPEISLAV